MATQRQIDDETEVALTAKQRDRLREILLIESGPGTAAYDDLEARVDALEPYQRQKAKAFIKDWDRIPEQPVKKSGGSKGIEYKTVEHELKVRNRLRVLLGWPELASSTSDIGVMEIRVGDGCARDEWSR